MTARASCLCGAVSWEIDAPCEYMSHCHCSRCRKAHGIAFATYGSVTAEDFRLQGDRKIVHWASSPGLSRAFCATCGSAVPGETRDERVFFPVGNFDDDPGGRPLVHIFAASKAAWHDITDDLPRFDTYPEGIDAPVLPDPPPLSPSATPRGSCMCGGVTFVLEKPPFRAYHCHCSRCRKGRSAAHATNVFAPADGVRWTRGEELVITYTLPQAKHFAQSFCRTCGSVLPRIDGSRDVAIVPIGIFDDDPGIRPESHIFVGSKAPWHEITDDLPQYTERPA